MKIGNRSTVGLDFETFCELDLKKVGVDVYVHHPSFRVLLAAIATESSELVIDFVSSDYEESTKRLERSLCATEAFAAHNAAFEYAVLEVLGILHHDIMVIDTAVLVRAEGMASSLEKAALQLDIREGKDAEGKRLIKKYCTGTHPTRADTTSKDWSMFRKYVAKDALVSLLIATRNNVMFNATEFEYEKLTRTMNARGWKVDLGAVDLMIERYTENTEQLLEQFKQEHLGPTETLNFNSLNQMKAWCDIRGVKAKSFNKASVEKLLAALEKRISNGNYPVEKLEGYQEVHEMLKVKQALGGSSLKKLQVIKNMTGSDGRLRNQYMHIGAGQTFRTSGRGAQLQNLKRLSTIADMEDLADEFSEWNNDDLAENIRQVFTATDPKGSLIVGDFSAIESRGLAWLAGDLEKLRQYKEGLDLYKVQAMKIKHIDHYVNVTDEDRKAGKVGELSCGYGAGPDAVASFAAGMGIELSPAEAGEIVRGWRDGNQPIVIFWSLLENALKKAITGYAYSIPLLYDYELVFSPHLTPASLLRQHPGSRSVRVSIQRKSPSFATAPLMQRVFHGCYLQGRNVSYYKPTTAGEKLWSAQFMDQKTKRFRNYDLYGGKLAGIITQSFCREIFFATMLKLSTKIQRLPELTIVGQFHDEIVFDFTPDYTTLEEAKLFIKKEMEEIDALPGFPLAASVKADYRYIK